MAETRSSLHTTCTTTTISTTTRKIAHIPQNQKEDGARW
jgi:hypothetical protein